jgi:CHAT domain-containing protein/Flp pilus assembly protein TadD
VYLRHSIIPDLHYGDLFVSGACCCCQGATAIARVFEARRLNEEMESLARIGRYAEAISRAERLLMILEQELGTEDLGVARLLNNMAAYYRHTGDYLQAESRYNRALVIVQKKLGPGHPTVVLVLNNLASLYKTMGDYGKAERLFKSTLAAAQRSGDTSVAVAQALGALGLFYAEKGDYEEAEPLLVRAITMLETLPQENVTLASTLSTLAMLHRMKMDYEEAEALFTRIISITERNPKAQDLTISSLTGLGGVYEDQGDFERAGVLYRRALEMAERTSGNNLLDSATPLNNVGLLYLRQGDYEHARPLLERALALEETKYGPDSLNLVSPLINLAFVYAGTGDIASATHLLSRSFNIREKTLNLVLNSGSEKQKQLYLATLDKETDGIVSVLVQTGSNYPELTDLAMTTILRRKGRVLDAMSKQIQTLRGQSDLGNSTLLDELAKARGRYATLVLRPSTEGDETQQVYRSLLEKQIEQLEQRTAAPSAGVRQSSQTVTVNRVQSTIPPEAALVDIVSYRPFNERAVRASDRFGASRYVAFVLHRFGKPSWIELGDAGAIEAMVSALRSAFRNPASQNAKAVARSLDEQVMRPIRRLLGDSRQILLSPDGELNLLPFGALVDEQNRYLIDTYSITYLTSGRDLLLNRSTNNQIPNPALVIGNPLFDKAVPAAENTFVSRALSPRSIDFTRFKYPPLPGTGLEAKEIGSLLNGSEILTEASATETAVKKHNHPQVLHLATHGFFLSNQNVNLTSGRTLERAPAVDSLENPLLRSGLILAGVTQRSSGPGEDGVLSAFEAASLDLQGTELVVLSACETGVGQIKVGQGVFGLRRALVLAGAASQVTTLWQVDDKSTRDLMVDFYTRLKRGEGKGEALRNAQLVMMKSPGHEHPYYWASFIEIGDWRPLQSFDVERVHRVPL